MVRKGYLQQRAPHSPTYLDDITATKKSQKKDMVAISTKRETELMQYKVMLLIIFFKNYMISKFFSLKSMFHTFISCWNECAAFLKCICFVNWMNVLLTTIKLKFFIILTAWNPMAQCQICFSRVKVYSIEISVKTLIKLNWSRIPSLLFQKQFLKSS